MEDIQFDSGKEFARYVLRELDALREDTKELRHDMKDCESVDTKLEGLTESSKEVRETVKLMHDSYIAFKSKVETIGGIVIIILGSLEGIIALYLIFSKS